MHIFLLSEYRSNQLILNKQQTNAESKEQTF